MLRAVIEFLGVSIPTASDGWLLHRVCVRLAHRQLAVVVSLSPGERGAMLDAALGRVIPTEGRLWVSRRPLARETVGDMRSRVIEADLSMPVAERRSLVWNTLAASPRGLVTALLRVPRERRRRAALEALDQVGLGEHAHELAGILDREGRARLAIARALSRRPDWLVIRDLDLALDAAAAERILALVGRIVRHEPLAALASLGLASSSIACARADRLVVLAEGLLTFDGPPRRFLERSATFEAM